MLSSKSRLAGPGGDREDTICFAEVARRGRDDRALGDHKLPPRADCETDILLAHEVQRGVGSVGRAGSRGAARGRGPCPWRRHALEAAGAEELVDPLVQDTGRDPAGRLRRGTVGVVAAAPPAARSKRFGTGAIS